MQPNLTRRFGALTAVDALNLEIARGEIFGLVGPDGAGKTTTLRLLCGLHRPHRGHGDRCRATTSRATSTPSRTASATWRSASGSIRDLTVEENMDFYADLFGVTGRERDSLMARLLAMTRMEPFRDRHAGKLSGGMKQKLALMCTLLHRRRCCFWTSRRTAWIPSRGATSGRFSTSS